jgi:hypothetical protein
MGDPHTFKAGTTFFAPHFQMYLKFLKRREKGGLPNQPPKIAINNFTGFLIYPSIVLTS